MLAFDYYLYDGCKQNKPKIPPLNISKEFPQNKPKKPLGLKFQDPN